MKRKLLFAVIFLVLFGFRAVFAALPGVGTTSGNLTTRVAPGELLPISIKLTNFGGSKRADVTITYSIVNTAGVVVLTSTETVAVETTASFIKVLQIPQGTPPGKYTAQSSIKYLGQEVPATSSYEFTVERKILGIFQSNLFLYGGIALFLSIVMVLLGRTLIKRRRRTMRLAPVDYSDAPHDTRVFYELISDTIMGMRQQVGESALNIAKRIDGLVIDEKTGRVLKLTEKPSKIIAELVSGYEKALGKKVSFSFRNS